MKDHIIGKYLFINRKELVTLNLFWIGFILYTVGSTLSTSKQFNFILLQAIQISGCFLFIPAAISLIKSNFDNQYLKILFLIYSSWLVSVFLRGFIFDYEYIKFSIFNSWFGGFIYFVPFFLLFPRNLLYYKKAFDVAIILSLFYVFYDIMFLNILLDPDKENITGQTIIEYFSRNLGSPLGFVLLTYAYHKKPKNFYVIFVTFLTVLLAVVRARRGLIVMIMLPVLFTYILYFFSANKKLLITILSGIVISTMLIYGTYIYHQNKETFFSLISERGMDDTRSGVENYFYKDMEFIDWVIGKGAQGEYYCPCPLVADEKNHRGMVETDYLNIILKGGLVSLILLLMITIPAAIKGIFFSKNSLSKASGIWIICWLVNLYPSTVFVFNLNHLMVWMAIGICYSKNIRNIPEDLLRIYFFTFGKKIRIKTEVGVT